MRDELLSPEPTSDDVTSGAEPDLLARPRARHQVGSAAADSVGDAIAGARGGAKHHGQGSSERVDSPAADVDTADDVVFRVGHVHVDVVGRNATRCVETGRSSDAVDVARLPSGPGQRGHHPGRGDHADGVVFRVGHIRGACAVDGNVAWRTKPGGCACAIGAAIRRVDIACEQGHGR